MPVEGDSRNAQTIPGGRVGQIHEGNSSTIVVRRTSFSKPGSRTIKEPGAIETELNQNGICTYWTRVLTVIRDDVKHRWEGNTFLIL